MINFKQRSNIRQVVFNVTRECWINLVCTHAVSCFLFVLARLILHRSAMITMTTVRIAAPMIAKATIISKAR